MAWFWVSERLVYLGKEFSTAAGETKRPLRTITEIGGGNLVLFRCVQVSHRRMRRRNGRTTRAQHIRRHVPSPSCQDARRRLDVYNALPLTSWWYLADPAVR